MKRIVLAVFVILAVAIPRADRAGAGAIVGDVITAANKERVKGLIPDPLYPFVIENFDGLKMTIVERRDYPPHPKYVEATVKYACQASIDEKGGLVNYTAGQPFPYSEWAKEATNHACDLTQDDPDFALKLAWNFNYRWQAGGLNLPHWGFTYERNSGKDVWRFAQGEYRRTYYSHRADLLPQRHLLEEDTDIEWAEFFEFYKPFDLRGTMYLMMRYTDYSMEDDTWAYIPALRRVRRVAVTQKSDSLLGSEFTIEDFYIFAGQVWNHSWEFKNEAIRPASMNSQRKCWPRTIDDREATLHEGIVRLGTREEFDQCRFGPYGALSWVDETWELRPVIELDDRPHQKGHPYSLRKMWLDKETFMPLYALMYDRAGEPYRIISSIFRWTEDSEVLEAHGYQVNTYAHILIANVQNGTSHTIQFDNCSVSNFSAERSGDYYDMTRLKKKGR
jgi:hypothetical protein